MNNRINSNRQQTAYSNQQPVKRNMVQTPLQYNNRIQPQVQSRNQTPPQIENMQNPNTQPQNIEEKYTLYYSNYCINCKEFMNILCKNPIYPEFVKINVSNSRYPSFVKSVPTIVVPKIARPLVGEEVFKWLETLSSTGIQNEKDGIVPYSPSEMGSGFGDNYSYFDLKEEDQPMDLCLGFGD